MSAAAMPAPVLDHVVVNVADRMDKAVEIWPRLGFLLTPRGFHTLGSINHLAIFGTDYLELIGAPSDGERLDIMNWPAGLNALVFGTEDSTATHTALVGAGVDCFEPLAFSRPVRFAGGTRDAVFRTVRLRDTATSAGRLYFCHHFTRDLVWRDEWRRHPNGTVGVSQFVIAAADPERLGALFARMFGGAAVAQIAGGLRLVAGLASVDVLASPEVERRYGEAVPQPDGREERMVALVLRTSSLDQAEASLAKGSIAGVRRETGSLLVPAAQTSGVTLDFREC